MERGGRDNYSLVSDLLPPGKVSRPETGSGENVVDLCKSRDYSLCQDCSCFFRKGLIEECREEGRAEGGRNEVFFFFKSFIKLP